MVAGDRAIWANRIRAYLSKFFNWCVERDILSTPPTDRVRQPAKNVSRARALSNEELAEVWCAVEEKGGIFSPLVKLLILTGQRLGEVNGMRWDELHLDDVGPRWELPGERTKNSLPHLVPLVPQVVKILKTIPRIADSPFVFTTTGMAPVSGHSNGKERLDALISKKRREAKITVEMPAWTFHDIRRTVSTRMHEDIGIQPHIVEAILNHVSGHRSGVAGTYNRAQYLDEKRRALADWANHIDMLLGRGKMSNVIPLHATR